VSTDSLVFKPTPEQAQMYELVHRLNDALASDGEQGAHWLNNVHAEEWAKKNPKLLKAIHALCEFVRDWGPA
jgi:hypothetical protein